MFSFSSVFTIPTVGGCSVRGQQLTGVEVRLGGQFLEKTFLVRCQLRRYDDPEFRVQIATPSAPAIHALAAQTEPLPGWVLGRIVSSTIPSSVGTGTLAPSAASQGATGRSNSRSSSPTIRNRGCGSRRTRRRRSPGEPPRVPGSPCPAKRITEPLRTPTGMVTSSDFGRRITPDPPHVGQVLSSFVPNPPQVEHVSVA